MKKIVLLVILAFSAGFFSSCEKDGPEAEQQDQANFYTSAIESHSYQVGFKDGALGNAYETNVYTSIALNEDWNNKWRFIPEIVKKPEIRRLLYSYQTQEHYYTATHNFYAYYSAIVKWEEYTEYKEYKGVKQSRNIQKYISTTLQYVGCTTGTPSQYIPAGSTPVVTKYPECSSAWLTINSGGSSTGGGNSTGGNTTAREYSYHCKTNSYKATGEFDDVLYIYKNGSDYRACWYYYAEGVDKSWSQKIYIDVTIILGTQYTYKIIPMGIPLYFNFQK